MQKELVMRISRGLVFVLSLISLAVAVGCGGGGGGSDSGSSSTGTVSMSITDAKPVLPETAGEEIENVFVTINEVLVHMAGGGWESLPLPKSPAPYRIDLLQFSEGLTTELVPPVALKSGKYTQVRLSVASAALTFKGNPKVEIPVTIPSENLKTDKNFDFDVTEGDAVDITIDFDLSKSLVTEGPGYKLKPVLHIVETDVAATIEGAIANDRFNDGYVVITVLDGTGQEYTRLQVDKDARAGIDDTFYAIFWLVPDQSYKVEVDYLPKTAPGTSVQSITVPAEDLGPGEVKTGVDFPVP
jgi:hypothetical protein